MPSAVELFGLPGAGKTTIVNGATADLPRETQFTTRAQVSAAWQEQPFLRRTSVVARALTDAEWMGAVGSLVLRTPLRKPESLRRLSRLTVNKAWLRSLKGQMLFDQGLLQRLWSIFYTEGVDEPPHAPLTRILRQFYQGMAVQIVAIEVSPEIAAERVHERVIGNSRLDDLPENVVQARLDSTARLPGALLSAARDAGLSVITLDGSAPLDVLFKQMQAILVQPAPRTEALYTSVSG